MANLSEQFQSAASAQLGVLRQRPRAAALGLALAAGSTLLAVWRLWRRRSKLQHFRRVPGGLPWLGNLFELMDVDRTIETFEGWARRYGEDGVFEFSLAGERYIIFCNYDKSLPLLALRPFKVARSTAIEQLGLVDKIQGLFFAEGRQWSTQRRLTAPAFNAKAIESYSPAVHNIIDNLLAQIDQQAASGELVNISLLARCFNADSISKLAFGQDFGSLSSQSADLADIMVVLDGLIKRMTSPLRYWKLPGLGNLVDGSEGALARLHDKMSSILDHKSDLDAATFLQKLLMMEGEKLTHEELIGNLIVFFIAGTDTSSHTLSWAFYHLARQPELQDTIAAEVVRLPGGAAAAQQINALSMTQAVWRETLRCNSVAPFLDFVNQEPITLHGREIPRHTHLWVLTREICRSSRVMQEALGADVDEFRPARWLDPNGGLVSCAPFDSLAFGHGARRCPGMDLANFTGPWVLAEVVRRFRIAQWEGPPLGEKSSFVQQPADDVQLRFIRRSP